MNQNVFRYLSQIIISCLLCSLALFSAGESNEQVLVWKGTPLVVHTKTGSDQLLVFPYDVNIDVPLSVASKLTSFMTRPGYWIISPGESFSPSLLRVSKKDGAAVMILRLKASPDGSNKTVKIVDGLEKAVPQKNTGSRVLANNPPGQVPPRIILARHAAQSLYAPDRLIPENTEIFRAPVAHIQVDAYLLRSQKGEHFTLKVIAGWRGFGYYLTAIEMVNQSDFRVDLDPRMVRFGGFHGVLFQHQYLTRSGSHEDRTTMYLLSEDPFEQALSEMHYVWK